MRHAVGPAVRCARLLALSLTMLAPAAAHADELRIVTDALPLAFVGSPYHVDLVAAGGSPPYRWSTNAGRLPGGLQLSAEGSISGTPRITFSGTVNLTVTDRTGQSAHADLVLKVGQLVRLEDPNITIRAEAPELVLGEPVSGFFFTASGGTPPYKWIKADGELPPGLELSADGVVSGKPLQPGVFHWVVKVWDATNRGASFPIGILVTPDRALRIDPDYLPEAIVGEPYELALESDGEGAVEFTVAMGSKLPDGLALDTDGRITGVPTGKELQGKVQGMVVFEVRVVDETYREGRVGLMLRMVAPEPGTRESSPEESGGCQAAGGELGMLGLVSIVGGAASRFRRRSRGERLEP